MQYIIVTLDRVTLTEDGWINLSEIDFIKGQGVRGNHILDEHAQRVQFGNLIHDFVLIQGDIYDIQPD